MSNDQTVLKYKNIQKQIRKKLELLLASKSLRDLVLIPSNRLEKLQGHKNLYSLRINQQYRLLFFWQNNEPYQITINKHDKNYGK